MATSARRTPSSGIAELYEIEAEAKVQGLGPEGRLALRQERSVGVLDRLEGWIDETKPKCTPKSPLACACRVQLNAQIART